MRVCAGSDPSKLVEEIAKRKKKRVMGVSLGQGQDVIARRLMATACAEGHWVLLQNAHLGLAYLAEVIQTDILNTQIACQRTNLCSHPLLDMQSKYWVLCNSVT